MEDPLSKTRKKDDIDLLKYSVRDDLADIMNFFGADRNEVVVFQDKYGILKTSNIKWFDIIRRVLGATTDNIPVFTDGGRIRGSNASIATIIDEIIKKYC